MKVVALVNRPKVEFFGHVSIVCQIDENTFTMPKIYGDESTWFYLDKRNFDYSVDSGFLLKLPEPIIVPDNVRNAGWLGEAFEAKRKNLNGPPIQIPPCHEVYRIENVGTFWFSEIGYIYPIINNWVRETAKLAIERKDKELAKLLEWAMPWGIDTITAISETCKNHKEREKELRWFIRTCFCDSELEEEESIKKLEEAIYDNLRDMGV